MSICRPCHTAGCCLRLEGITFFFFKLNAAKSLLKEAEYTLEIDSLQKRKQQHQRKRVVLRNIQPFYTDPIQQETSNNEFPHPV